MSTLIKLHAFIIHQSNDKCGGEGHRSHVFRDVLGAPLAKTPLTVQGVGVRSLAGELRPHIPCSQKIKINKKFKKEAFIYSKENMGRGYPRCCLCDCHSLVNIQRDTACSLFIFLYVL